MLRLNTYLIVGEDTKEDVSDTKGAKLFVNSCIWCDKKVWVSEFGYTAKNPISDISITKLEKDAKALHKFCLLEIMQYTRTIVGAMEANIKTREK